MLTPEIRCLFLWPGRVLAAARGILPRGAWALPWQLGSVSLAVSAGLAALRSVASPPARDQIPILSIGRWLLSHWTTQKVPNSNFLKLYAVVIKIQTQKGTLLKLLRT